MKNHFLLILLVVGSASAQTTGDSLQFPEDFFGLYKGDLHITSYGSDQIIQMEFHLNPTDSIGKYQYMLVYIVNGERQERKYNLITKDATKGEYIIDENNGILLEAKLVDNTLYCMFEVNRNILTTTERFYKDAMDFEITFTDSKKKLITESEGEASTKVISYPIAGRQKAHLIKQ